jgi:hypothetical protein
MDLHHKADHQYDDQTHALLTHAKSMGEHTSVFPERKTGLTQARVLLQDSVRAMKKTKEG